MQMIGPTEDVIAAYTNQIAGPAQPRIAA
jgi:hypothetical protein